MFDITLGNMLPKNFYPITGQITITDINTDQPVSYGTCEIPRYIPYDEQANCIYLDNYYLVGHRIESNTITIDSDEIPPTFKYQIIATVDDKDFNKLCITGLCRSAETEMSFNGENSRIKLLPVRQVDINNNEFKLCDISIWKEAASETDMI